MKRRRFLQAIAAAPAAPLAAQHAAEQAPPARSTGAPFGAGQTSSLLETTAADLTADANAPAFFSPAQYAALRRLGALFEPALDGHPGASEAGASEFLDFLIGVSPSARQQLYQHGLDALNTQAHARFHQPFADLDDRQADAILHPLLAPIAWPEDLPHDPVRRFLAQAQRDFRTATANSREWAASRASSGRRARGGAGLYWLPIDPVVKA